MGKLIYVGNLPYDATENEVKDIFIPFGTVSSVRLISDKYTGRSKGFGFVEFDNDSNARTAIEQLTDVSLKERKLVINEAREREERPRFNKPRGGGFGGGGNSHGGGFKRGFNKDRQ